eukprot:4451240-Alexandrium_andersonii.AAC.1
MHAIKHWSTTQKTIALSSGEAELAGIVKGAAEGLGRAAIAQDSCGCKSASTLETSRSCSGRGSKTRQ